MTAKAIVALAVALSTAPAARAQDYSVPTDEIFHYSVMDAMRNGVYQGQLTVDQLKAVGDFGLGTFNHLDGELVGLDGVFYRVAGDGSVKLAEAGRKIPFGSFAFFKPDVTFALKVSGGFDDLQQQILNALPSRNQLYAVRIEGTFAEATAGGANKVADGDKTPIGELMKTRPLYTAKNVTGTIVGFYHPPYVGGIDLSPFHLHFISKDKSFGGHIVALKLEGSELQLALDAKKGIDIELPQDNADFRAPWSTNSNSQKSY